MLKNFTSMLIVTVVVMIISIALLIKIFSRGEQTYDVFMIEGNELIVMSGIPTKYIIDDIEMITFSKIQQRYRNFMGVMKITKKNGIISRRFLFDASVYYKQFVLDSTEEEIDRVTEDLMEQLRNHGIKCIRKGEDS